MDNEEMKAAVQRATSQIEAYEDTLLWRLNYAYNHPIREFLLLEASAEIEKLRKALHAANTQLGQLETERDQWIRQAIGRD